MTVIDSVAVLESLAVKVPLTAAFLLVVTLPSVATGGLFAVLITVGALSVSAGVALLTLAVLSIVVPVLPVTLSVTLAVAILPLSAMTPRLQVTTPEEAWLHEPCVALAETKLVAAGTVTATETAGEAVLAELVTIA